MTAKGQLAKDDDEVDERNIPLMEWSWWDNITMIGGIQEMNLHLEIWLSVVCWWLSNEKLQEEKLERLGGGGGL